MRKLPIALLLAAIALHARADVIDDAEAKRRNVPVAQIQAENALAAEKRKTAELTKQVADLQKRLADFKAQQLPPTLSPPPPETAPSPGGPIEPSALYDELVRRYLAGEWATLQADLTRQQKDIAALPPRQSADIATIREALAECHPAWWEQAKTGKPFDFKATLWKQTVAFHYQSNPIGPIQRRNDAGALSYDIRWPHDHMDSTTPDERPAFSDGDALNEGIWRMIENARILQEFIKSNHAPLTPDQQRRFERYILFRQFLTAAYYGTPHARQRIFTFSIASLMPMYDDNDYFAPRRPLGSSLLIEFLAHADCYPSVLFPQEIIALPPASDVANESFLGGIIRKQFEEVHFTLAEDKALRDLLKSLADSTATLNTFLTDPTLTLPNKLTLSLDPALDPPLAIKRYEWLRTQLAPKKPAPATRTP